MARGRAAEATGLDLQDLEALGEFRAQGGDLLLLRVVTEWLSRFTSMSREISSVSARRSPERTRWRPFLQFPALP